MADFKLEELGAVAGYDEHGNATVFYLAADEKLPAGYSATPPKGTHPHEQEAAANTTSTPVEPAPAQAEELPLETPPPKPKRAELEEMTKDELIAIADDRDIDIPRYAVKADIIDAIVHSRK